MKKTQTYMLLGAAALFLFSRRAAPGDGAALPLDASQPVPGGASQGGGKRSNGKKQGSGKRGAVSAQELNARAAAIHVIDQAFTVKTNPGESAFTRKGTVFGKLALAMYGKEGGAVSGEFADLLRELSTQTADVAINNEALTQGIHEITMKMRDLAPDEQEASAPADKQDEFAKLAEARAILMKDRASLLRTREIIARLKAMAKQ